MKFTKATIEILKNFATINTSIMLQPGQFVMTKSINGVAYAEANIPDTIDTPLGIYDLPSFLSILMQFGEDSEVTTDPQTQKIVISNKRAKVMCTDADASTIVSPKKRLQMPVADVIFELAEKDLNDITKISRTVGADMVAITTRDGRLFADAFSSEDQSKQTRYSLDIGEYDGQHKFSFVLNLANFKMLPGSYKVMISSKGAAKFESDTASYVIVLETSSESDF